MKAHWIPQTFTYDGSQLHSLFAYLGHEIDGDSIVSWVGPCNISIEHMVDGEDLLDKAEIRGSEMLHFIIEIFDRDLFSGVAVQRIMASLAKDVLEEMTPKALKRDGDDLYVDGRKLSISIATKSPISTMVHFAMNVSNAGTPVKTCALKDDFGLSAKEVASALMLKMQKEYLSILFATRKVRPVG